MAEVKKPATNGNGWAVNALKYILGAALGYLILVNTWLVTGQFRADARGEANRLAIEKIEQILSGRALAEKAEAKAQADALRAQVAELQRQQRQERETQEPIGRPAPSGE